MPYPEILHHGAALGVTGSCHQLLMDMQHSLLIDCGLFQGAEISADGRGGAGSLAIDFPLDTVKTLVATHVHIDHVGWIPYLLTAGFKGPILCSEPSARLLPIVLEDAFKLGVSGDQRQVERYLTLIGQRLITLPYKHWSTLADTPALLCKVRLQRAGHILGLAYVEVDLAYKATGRKRRILWPQLPIILDSPLASRFTQAYRELQPFWDQEAISRIKSGRRPLGFELLVTLETHADHLRTVEHLASTAIVIVGSGMCTSGRIVNYLKAMLDDRRHNVLFVGYQAMGTPGHAIQKYGPRGGYVELDGERLAITAGITTLGGYSAHADRQGLVSFISRMREWPDEIRLVHGEAEAKRALAAELQHRYEQRQKRVNMITP